MQLAVVGSAYDVAQGAELLEAHLVQLAVIGRALFRGRSCQVGLRLAAQLGDLLGPCASEVVPFARIAGQVLELCGSGCVRAMEQAQVAANH